MTDKKLNNKELLKGIKDLDLHYKRLDQIERFKEQHEERLAEFAKYTKEQRIKNRDRIKKYI